MDLPSAPVPAPATTPVPTPATGPADEVQLPGRVRRGYALGGIASSTFGTVPGLLLMPYLTDVIGIGAALAGLVVFLPKAWDFFLNPVAGRISDASTHPRGHRRPFVLRGGLLMAAGFTFVFVGPTTSAGLATAWVVVAFLAASTAYAFFQVPYLAMSAEMTPSYTERTRLMTWRVLVITATIMVVGAGAPLIVALIDGAAGYRVMAVVMSLLIVLGVLGLWRGTRDVPLARVQSATGTLREQVAAALSSRPAKSLLTAFVLQAVALTMVLAGINYTATHVMGDKASATYVFVAFVCPALLFAPLWGRIGVRWGKKRGVVLCSWVLIIGLVSLAWTSQGELVRLLISSGVVGIGYAGAQLFPLAMLPDVAAHDAEVSGENRIGLLTGTWAGFELLGFALGPFVYGLVLQLGGFASGSDTQSDQALAAVVAGVSWIPAILVTLSLVAVRFYTLDETLRRR